VEAQFIQALGTEEKVAVAGGCGKGMVGWQMRHLAMKGAKPAIATANGK